MSWKHFSRDEFKCKCGCGRNEIKDDFVTRLDALREELGFPIRVSSGYRCPAHNAKVSSTGLTGPHTTGYAADLLVDRGKAYALVVICKNYGFTGIGCQQKGNVRFIHLDCLPDAPGQPRPTVWSY